MVCACVGVRMWGRGRRLRALLFALAVPVLLALATPAAAQDTTRTPADTLRRDTTRRDTIRRDTTLRDTVRGDSLAADTTRSVPRRREALSVAEALGFDTPRRGRVVGGGRLPVRDPALDATGLLARAPAAFRYDFGAAGWPHGVSIRGRPPDQTALTLDGLPFDDPLTGRPRYDLLPLPFLNPLRVESGGALGAPGAVRTTLRPYAIGAPFTEARYRAGGLQSIGALHTQRRQVRFFGVPAVAQFTGGYFGRGADNLDFLRGSGLRTERRLLARVRYRRRAWALQLLALHNRRRIGANGGVALPDAAPIALAFQRQPARFPDAQTRLKRTDLAATLRLREVPLLPPALAAAPLTATAYRTAQTHRYRNAALTDALPAADTLAAETARYGLRLTQPLALDTERFGQHALSLRAHAWADRLTEGNALPDGDTRLQAHLAARDSVRLRDWSAVLRAGLHAGPRQTYPSATLRLARVPSAEALPEEGAPADSVAEAASEDAPGWVGSLRLFGEVQLSGQPVSWIADAGFGPAVRPLPEGTAPGRVLGAEVGAEARAGPVALRLAAFAERTTDRLDLYAVNDSVTAQAALSPGTFQQTGATLSGRWRFREARGFYATASATAFLQNGNTAFSSRAAPTVPRVHGQGRLGARYALFTGDLAVDAYVRGRFWTQMESRTLHGPTGRLVVPPTGRRTLGPTGVVDLHAEATVRTATLFFSYENALSNTGVQAGVVNVPVYPLPARQFRFGVYWPISN